MQRPATLLKRREIANGSILMTHPKRDGRPPNDPSPSQTDDRAAPEGHTAPNEPATPDMSAVPDETAAGGAPLVPNAAAVPAQPPHISLPRPNELPDGSAQPATTSEVAAGCAAPCVHLGARLLFSWHHRTVCLLGGVVVPVISLWIGFPDQPAWQSGRASDYARLLLAPRCGWPLWPFLAFNMVCLTLALYRPDRFGNRFLVRWGVYSGALTAAVYWALFGVALVGDLLGFAGWLLLTLMITPFAYGFAYVGLAALGALARRLWRCETIVKSILIAAVVVLVLGVEIVGAVFCAEQSVLVSLLLASVGVTVFTALLFSTPLAVLSYAIVSIELLRREAAGQGALRYSLAQLVAVLTWLAAWLGAWRTAYLRALDVYSLLPVNPPTDCYVSTAAARGHRRVVRSAVVVGHDGRRRRVNDQMRVLKAAELALRAGWPRAHRVCRRLYDRLGPPLARRLRYAWMADLAYLALKPAEWLARIGLAALAPGSGKWIERLYGRDDLLATEELARDP